MSTLSGVDPLADRPLCRQLADLIRTQITDGVFVAGQRLPAQKDYVQEHGVSRDTVDRAMTVLRQEGLIVTSRRGPVFDGRHRPRLYVSDGGGYPLASRPNLNATNTA